MTPRWLGLGRVGPKWDFAGAPAAARLLKCPASEDTVNRRQLLQAGLFSTGYVLASYRSAHAAPTQQKPKIVIIGAGLSGLASAWELRKKGLDVVILEATKRVGGRVLTDRDNFLDGQYTEQGATLIPDNHDLTLSHVACLRS